MICVGANVLRTRFYQFIAEITGLTERDRLSIRALYHKRIAHRPPRKLYRRNDVYMCMCLRGWSNCVQFERSASISIYFSIAVRLPANDLFKSATFDSFYSVIIASMLTMLSAYEMNQRKYTRARCTAYRKWRVLWFPLQSSNKKSTKLWMMRNRKINKRHSSPCRECAQAKRSG